MKKTYIVLLFVGILVMISCKKDANKFKKVSATVIFAGGDPAANGCGYLIQVDNIKTNYYPINLNDAYKKNQLKIIVDYHLLDTKYQCGFLPADGSQEVNIDNINLR